MDSFVVIIYSFIINNLCLIIHANNAGTAAGGLSALLKQYLFNTYVVAHHFDHSVSLKMNQLFIIFALMLVAHSMAFRALKPVIARTKAPLKMIESLPEAVQTAQSFLVASEPTAQDSLFGFLFLATCIMGKILQFNLPIPYYNQSHNHDISNSIISLWRFITWISWCFQVQRRVNMPFRRHIMQTLHFNLWMTLLIRLK